MVVRVKQAWFICWAGGSDHRTEGLVIVLSSAIIASELFDIIALAHRTKMGLKVLAGGSSSVRPRVWEHAYECEAGLVVNE